jgi:hypothetical protein
LDDFTDLRFTLSPGAGQVELELEEALIEGSHLRHNMDAVSYQFRAPKASHASHRDIIS